MTRFEPSLRHTAIGSFLAGMLCMGLIFLALGASGPREASADYDQCGRSIAVANALHGFIEEQHGALSLPDGTRIVRDEELGVSSWKFGKRP